MIQPDIFFLEKAGPNQNVVVMNMNVSHISHRQTERSLHRLATGVRQLNSPF